MYRSFPEGAELPGPDVSIVVPVYNSADCLWPLYEAIDTELSRAELEYELILVNDGSRDMSWSVIEEICAGDPRVVGIDMRRNFGQDNSILSGLRCARGRFAAVMDDDLQHHPKFLPAMLAEIEKGFDVVYANFEAKRQRAWKNLGSHVNGKIAEFVIDKPKGVYLSPYKVIRGDVVNAIAEYVGPAPYIDGLLFQTTARIGQITADHYPRLSGKSNYTFLRSLRVSARLAFSFSAKPLRLVTGFGFALSALGLMLVAGVVGYRLLAPENFTSEAVGWASLMVAILLVAGLQMIFFGTLGEYTGRMFLLVSRKPQSAVREMLNGPAAPSASPTHSRF